MYPKDAVTLHHELSGPSSFTLVSGTNVKYILGLSMQQSGTASTSRILCGTAPIALNYGKDFSFNDIQYRCAGSIILDKTGQDSSSFIVTYVPRDILVDSAPAGIAVDFATPSATAINNSLATLWIMLGAVIFLLAFRVGVHFFGRSG